MEQIINKEKQVHLFELDFVRSIAIILVVGLHFGLYLDFIPGYNTITRAGALGVQIFFILSSFLLAQPFIKWLIQNGSFPSIKSYAAKRFLRIWPLFIATSLVLYLISFKQIEASIFDIANYVFFVKDVCINPVVWSLFVEVKFYILLPLVFVFIKKAKIQSFFIPLMILLLVSSYGYKYFQYIILGYEQAASICYISFWANLDSFILGVILCYLIELKKEKKHTKNGLIFSLIALISVIYILMHLYAYGENKIFKSFCVAPIFSLCVACIIYIIIQLKKHNATELLNNWITMKLSVLSYGIYMYHLPIRYYMLQVSELFCVKDSPLYFLVQFCLSWILTLIFAVISYHFFELPIMNTRERLLKLMK